MPRAGFLRYPESYSVYVNGPSSAKGAPYRHEVVVPMHEAVPRPEGSTGSSAATKDSANSSSLATHV